MLVHIEQGADENKRILQEGSKSVIAAIHLDPSAEPYLLTVNLDSGSGSTTMRFVIKVDGPTQ